MKHTEYKCPQPCQKVMCNYCDGGLFLCTVCGGAEGTLTTDCCGKRISKEQEKLIYEGSPLLDGMPRKFLDFKEGEGWFFKPARKTSQKEG